MATLTMALVVASAAIAADEDAAWAPTPADAAEFDWLRIDSGEWLKGELIVVQSRELRFDSDEFKASLVSIERKEGAQWKRLAWAVLPNFIQDDETELRPQMKKVPNKIQKVRLDATLRRIKKGVANVIFAAGATASGVAGSAP